MTMVAMFVKVASHPDTHAGTNMHGASRLQQSAGHPSIQVELNRGFILQ